MKLAVVGDASSVNVQEWCSALAGAGAQVHLLSFASPPRPVPFPTSRLRRAGLPPSVAYVVGSPLARRVIDDLQPDVVIGYFATGYGTLARLSAGVRPVVQVVVGSDVLMTPARSVTAAFLRRNLRRASLVVAWAPHLAAAARAAGAAGEVFVLPRGIRSKSFMPIGQTRVPGDDHRVVMTRSLSPLYRHDLAIAAFSILGSRGYRLTIAGDGPSRGKLERLVGKLGLAGLVDLVGVVDNAAMPTILAAHDTYLSLTASDGVSPSLLEAMAAGLVPVVVDHPANRDWLVDGVTGLLLPPDSDPARIADAIIRSAEDADLRAACRRVNPDAVRTRADIDVNARTFLERFGVLN